MNRKYDDKKNLNANSSMPAKPYENLGGTAHSEKGDRAARHFSRKNALEFWKGIGAHENDNIGITSRNRPKKIMRVLAATAIFGAVLSLNSSELITHTVLHTDSELLATAMEVNPGSVAFMLNQINVGE